MSTPVHTFADGTQVRRFASGRLVEVRPDGSVRVLDPVEVDNFGEYLYGPDAWEGPSCSLCDALGHGYPGGGPCPLEERGWMEAEADLRRYGAY